METFPTFLLSYGTLQVVIRGIPKEGWKLVIPDRVRGDQEVGGDQRNP